MDFAVRVVGVVCRCRCCRSARRAGAGSCQGLVGCCDSHLIYDMPSLMDMYVFYLTQGPVTSPGLSLLILPRSTFAADGFSVRGSRALTIG